MIWKIMKISEKCLKDTHFFCLFSLKLLQIRNLGTWVLRSKNPTHSSSKNPGFKPGLGLWVQSLLFSKTQPLRCKTAKTHQPYNNWFDLFHRVMIKLRRGENVDIEFFFSNERWKKVFQNCPQAKIEYERKSFYTWNSYRTRVQCRSWLLTT